MHQLNENFKPKRVNLLESSEGRSSHGSSSTSSLHSLVTSGTFALLVLLLTFAEALFFGILKHDKFVMYSCGSKTERCSKTECFKSLDSSHFVRFSNSRVRIYKTVPAN